jgi:hypothetical protein
MLPFPRKVPDDFTDAPGGVETGVVLSSASLPPARPRFFLAKRRVQLFCQVRIYITNDAIEGNTPPNEQPCST